MNVRSRDYAGFHLETAYAGSALTGGNPPSLFGTEAFDGFTGGVFVG